MHGNFRSGSVLTRLVMILTGSALVMGSLYLLLMEIRRTMACEENLHAIYRALELYELERGTLPKLAFFPDQPAEDADSVRVVLQPFGMQPHHAICPSATRVEKELGLTYIWNTALNGQPIPRDEPVWMLTEMDALSPDLPKTHVIRYNVLFSDGSVRRIRTPLGQLKGL